MDPENVGLDAIATVTHWLRGIWEMRRRTGPVQQWVDSIPAYDDDAGLHDDATLALPRNSKTPNVGTNGSVHARCRMENTDSSASAPISIPNSPAITTTGVMSSVPLARLVRDPSFQSDSSHCSSVESLLEWRKADPEAILLGLGFGYPSSPQENGSLSRIPKRFLQPSKMKGIAINDFLKRQQESSESLDSASLGYRGLTGSPYVAPSEIVQKIMERLREHESHESDSYPVGNNQGELFSPMQQEGRLSVLSPNNRQYLERPRSKSPDMRNKRMIIGEKSFAFGYDGDLIEINASNLEDPNFDVKPNRFDFNFNQPKDRSESRGNDIGLNSRLEINDAVATKTKRSPDRKLAKQVSFDEDSRVSSRLNVASSDEWNGITEERKDSEDYAGSLVTVISRSLATDDDDDDDESTVLSRRASDGICELKSRGAKEGDARRSSDTALRTNMENARRNNASLKELDTFDKRRAFKRQARVTETDDGNNRDFVARSKSDLEPDNRIVAGNRVEFSSTNDDGIGCNDFVPDSDDIEIPNLGSSSLVQNDDDLEIETQSSPTDENAACCPANEHLCCKNDKLDQICEHEETCAECCYYNVSETKCWRKMAKVMQKNQQLETMVKKSRQEVATLREMMSSVLSVRMEPGF